MMPPINQALIFVSIDQMYSLTDITCDIIYYSEAEFQPL